MEPCYFCGDKRCEGCPLPYSTEMTYSDLLSKIDQKSNNSFYGDAAFRGKKDVIIEVVWNQAIGIEKAFFA